MRLDPDDVIPGPFTPIFRMFESASLEDLIYISAGLGFNEYIWHVDCWFREHGISAVSDPSYVRVIQTRDQLIKALEDVIIEKELEEK